jgi:hypothetical protein
VTVFLTDAMVGIGAKLMTQSIQTSVDRTVSDITPTQRHAIEELVGGDLDPDQRIFVLAYRPEIEPSEAVKSVARSRIEELLTKANKNAHQQNLAPTEIEAAIAEAIQSTDE